MKNRILRYQISDWSQISQCKSNNSKNFSISVSKILDGDKLHGLVLRVNHTNYGPVFAAMIQGSGTLLTATDESGLDLPFLTTEEILRQIMKFGFYVVYDVKKDLPIPTLTYLATLHNLGYDKISQIVVADVDTTGQRIWRPTVIVMKSEQNYDLLTFNCKVTRKVFDAKLEASSIVNVTNQPDTQWDWVTYIANIADILNENVDPINELNIVSSQGRPAAFVTTPEGFTEYTDESSSIDSSSFEGIIYTDPDGEESVELDGLEG